MLEVNKSIRIGVMNGHYLNELITQSYNRQNGENKQILCCRHLLEQQSMYPIYPSALMPLDISRIDTLAWREIPDIHIIATDKMKFIHNVDGVLFIAPGPLALGNGEGSYVRLTIYPHQRAGENEMAANDLSKRCKAELISLYNCLFLFCNNRERINPFQFEYKSMLMFCLSFERVSNAYNHIWLKISTME